MSGMLLVSSLALIGAAIALRLLRRAAPPASRRSASLPSRPGEDLLPGAGDDGRGLAAFYAYQMAASRIERPSVG
jgi:hypothetical protein